MHFIFSLYDFFKSLRISRLSPSIIIFFVSSKFLLRSLSLMKYFSISFSDSFFASFFPFQYNPNPSLYSVSYSDKNCFIFSISNSPSKSKKSGKLFFNSSEEEKIFLNFSNFSSKILVLSFIFFIS